MGQQQAMSKFWFSARERRLSGLTQPHVGQARESLTACRGREGVNSDKVFHPPLSSTTFIPVCSAERGRTLPLHSILDSLEDGKRGTKLATLYTNSKNDRLFFIMPFVRRRVRTDHLKHFGPSSPMD